MIYENVLDYCKQNNLTIRGFEKLCGIGNGVVRAWENENKPRLDTLEKIAEKTGVPLEKWLEDRKLQEA